VQLRRKRKGERVEFITSDVSSTDDNGRSEAAAMVNGVLERVCGCDVSAKGRA
jgi:hypothetical protein